MLIFHFFHTFHKPQRYVLQNRFLIVDGALLTWPCEARFGEVKYHCHHLSFCHQNGVGYEAYSSNSGTMGNCRSGHQTEGNFIIWHHISVQENYGKRRMVHEASTQLNIKETCLIIGHHAHATNEPVNSPRLRKALAKWKAGKICYDMSQMPKEKKSSLWVRLDTHCE